MFIYREFWPRSHAVSLKKNWNVTSGLTFSNEILQETYFFMVSLILRLIWPPQSFQMMISHQSKPKDNGKVWSHEASLGVSYYYFNGGGGGGRQFHLFHLWELKQIKSRLYFCDYKKQPINLKEKLIIKASSGFRENCWNQHFFWSLWSRTPAGQNEHQSDPSCSQWQVWFPLKASVVKRIYCIWSKCLYLLCLDFFLKELIDDLQNTCFM